MLKVVSMCGCIVLCGDLKTIDDDDKSSQYLGLNSFIQCRPITKP